MTDKETILKNLKLELRKGTLVLAVLSQLTEKHYGYSLVESLNNKELEIDQNTLYPLLRRLSNQGLLDATWEVADPRPRKYYQLSEMGKAVFNDLKAQYEINNNIINRILKEEK